MRLECIQPHGTEWNFVHLHSHVSQFNAVQKSLQKVPGWIIFHRLAGVPASSEEEWGHQFVTKTGSSQQLINKNSVDTAGATIFIRTAQHFLRKRKAENSLTGFFLAPESRQFFPLIAATWKHVTPLHCFPVLIWAWGLTMVSSLKSLIAAGGRRSY